MKNASISRKWKRMVSSGLSLAMAASLFSAVPISAAPSKEGDPGRTAEVVSVIEKTPVTDKAGSIPMSQLEDNETVGHPFPKGTAGSEIFRIPAIHTMENGELISIADIRYTQTVDGNGLDTIASVSSDGGKTWEYGFPIYLPDSYRDSYRQSTSSIDPGLLEGPDGTLYCIADVFPTEYSIQNIGGRLGTGYVEIDGEKRLALTDNYNNIGTAPVDDNDVRYLYYVDEFEDGYAQILTRDNHMPTGYAVDEWYNLYSVDENGGYINNLKQPQINNETHEVQQNVYYRDSIFHVYQTGYLWVVTSKDHGRTWEHPRDIIPQVKQEDDQAFVISPGCGLTTRDGTLVIGCYYHGKGSESGVERASLLYSSDNGITWYRTDDISTTSSENEVVELEDGTIRMFYRGWSGKIAYADFTKNEDGGYDVGQPVEINECPVTSTCNMGAIAYSKKINGKQAILVSWPEGPGGIRSNGKIFTFLVNEDNTMTLYHKLHVEGGEESFSYSNLTELSDGSVGLLWEGSGYNTEIWYERYYVPDFAPGAVLEGQDGSETVFAAVEKDEVYTKTYTAQGEAGAELVQVAPNENVALAKAEKAISGSVKVPVYHHASHNSDPNIAFATGTAQAELLEMTDVEFTFTKNGDSYHIKNEKSGKFLTFNQASAGGDNYFSMSAADVTINPQSSGTIRLQCQYKDGGGNNAIRHIALYKPAQRFNAWSDLTHTGDSVYDFTLWERAVDAPSDSKLPGYKKVLATDSNLTGKSYLITAESDGYVYLLYPENGEHNQTKLIAVHSDSRPEVPEPVITTKNEITVTITGKNEGFTKAVIDGKEYRIQVTDRILRKPVGENVDIVFEESYEVLDGDGTVASVTEVAGDQASLYDYVSQVSGSLNSFSKKKNETLSVANAELTFTKDTEKEAHWFIQNGDMYMIHDSNGNRDLFSTTRQSMAVVRTEGAGTFQFYNSLVSGGRYLMFYTATMRFDATTGLGDNSAFKYDLTLWKKDNTAMDSLIPGYKRVGAGEDIENNGIYLVTYIFQEGGEDRVILLYPKNATSISMSGGMTKLARINNSLRITPKASGSFRIKVDGTVYKYQFVESNCTHPANKEIIKGYMDADCEKDGYTGDTVCDACDVVKSQGKAISAAGHKYGVPLEKQALTEEKNGIYLAACANSNLHQKETVVYASAYKRLKELFQAPPEEISDNVKGLYREKDVAALKNAYDAGGEVSIKEAGQQTNEEMYSCIEAFSNAKTKLHRRRDALVAELSSNLRKAEPIHEAGKKDYYKEADWDAFEAAYSAAMGINVGQEAYAGLEAAVANLKNSCSKIVYQGYKGNLQTLYNTYKDLQKGDYSDRTWAIFTAALDAAKGILEKEDASLQEITAAEEALDEAVDGLQTAEEEKISVPGGIAYTAPAEGAYPKAAAVTVAENDQKHMPVVSDWTEEAGTLVRKDEALEAEYVKKDGIWGFNDQLKSDNQKYNVNGQNSMAITLKLWLNTIQTSKQAEILAKGTQYSLQLKGGELVLWMLYDSYPTEALRLGEGHTNKWLDVVIVIDGANGKQRLYVDGSASHGINEGTVNLRPSSEPFTVGYRSGGDGIPFTKDIGYMADIKFYDCGTDDVTNGLTRNYETIVNLLNAKTPNAVISAAPYHTKTMWSSVEEGNSSVLEGTAKFAADTSYKATTTFWAHDFYLFPDTEEFCAAVAEKVSTGKDNAQAAVAVSEDQKTMTVEVYYPSGEIVEPVECTCSIGEIDISGGTELLIPSKAENGTLQLAASAAADGSCQVEGHPEANEVTYTYAVKEGAGNNTAGASVQADTGLVTATQEGNVVITVTVALADGTEAGKSKTKEIMITVTKVQPDMFRVAFDANAGTDIVQGMPEAASVEDGSKFGKPTEEPTRTGYLFKGWSASAGGTVIADAEWPVEINADTTFYAVWEEEPSQVVTYKVMFEANAGTDTVQGMPAAANVESGSKFGKPTEEPTRTGYLFKGWSASAGGTVIADAEWPVGINADTTFYAVWEEEPSGITMEEAEAAVAAAISAAESLYQAGQGNFSKESWTVFDAAYKATKNPVAGISPAELKQLADNLVYAQAHLALDHEEIMDNANKSLAIAASKVKAVNAGTEAYTASSWAAYRTAYDALQKAVNGNAGSESLIQLQKELAKAESMLQADTAWMNAKKALEKALNTAKPKYGKGSKAYTSATWKPFKTAYDNAYKQRNATALSCSAAKLKDLAAKLDKTCKALKKAPVLKKGDYIIKGNVKYVVANASKKTVVAEGLKSKKSKKFSVNILSSVTIKGTKCKVTEVKAKAFYKFTKITKVTVGSSVTKIGNQAFYGCKSITALNVSGNVKTFGKQSFYGCKKLKKVVFKAKGVPAFGAKAFKGTPSNTAVSLNKKMNKKDKAKIKARLYKAGISKKAKVK